jgi:TP901 family phage tail tape measure protein
MGDTTLNLAMRISAIDLFSGVLRSFRSQIQGTGAAAKAMQADYDEMISHASAGLKALAIADYSFNKLKPAVKDAADLQEALLGVEGILQGAHPNAGLLADQMARVRQNSVDIAAHMKYGADEITNVTRELLQGGVPLEAILGPKGAAFSVEALAEVSKTDPAETAKNIANIGHAFQLRPDQYGGAADLVARASITGSGSITQLFHNLEQVGAIAHMSGDDLKSTLVALKALAPLGEQGGSDLAAVIQTMEGGRARGQKWMQKAGLNFYDKKGNFIGLDASLEKLRVWSDKEPDQHSRLAKLGMIFQAGGSKAIEQLLAPSSPGVKSYAEVKASVDEQASLQQRMETWEKGLNASLQEMGTTNKTTLATLFDPMLGKMTAAIKLSNELSGSLGTYASKHPAVADTASIGTAAVVAGAGSYGIYRMIQAMGSGSKFLKGLMSGTASVSVGIAEGKAVEAATGVVPVFVTNFPSSFGGSGVGAAEDAATVAKDAGKAAATGGGFMALMRSWGLVGIAAGGTYALAKTGNHYDDAVQASQDESDAARWKNGGRYDALQPKGENRHLTAEEVAARQAMEKRMPYGDWYNKNSSKYHFWENDRPINDWKSEIAKAANQQIQVGGTIHIKIDQDGRASVSKIVSANPKVPIDVGTMMGTP